MTAITPPQPPRVAACRKDVSFSTGTIVACMSLLVALCGIVIQYGIVPQLAQRDDVHDLKRDVGEIKVWQAQQTVITSQAAELAKAAADKADLVEQHVNNLDANTHAFHARIEPKIDRLGKHGR
jgi:hypothetical protein